MNFNIDEWFTKSGTINARLSKNIPEIVYDKTSFMDPLNPTNGQRLRAIKEGLSCIPMCEVCHNNPCQFNKNKGKLFKKTCSFICANKHPDKINSIISNTDYKKKSKKAKETNIKKYGKPVATNVHEATILKYGQSTSSLDFVKRKKADTLNKKYGVFNAFQTSNSIKNRKKALNIQGKEIYSRAKKTKIEKFNWYWQDEEWLIEQIIKQKKSCSSIAEEYGVAKTTIYNAAKSFGIDYYNKTGSTITKPHRYVSDWLNKNKIDHKNNDRTEISPLELDIYIPEFKLGIEINGIYWHSDNFQHKMNHTKKLDICKEKGIRLLQIWDYEILEKWPKIESILQSALNIPKRKIYARNCNIKVLKNSEIKKFLDENHLSGYCHAKVNLCLVYGDEIIQLMSFGTPRYSKEYDCELIRLCSKKDVNIIGGSEKLFYYFIKNYNPSSIVSFSDRRIFTGQVYGKLGFKFDSVTPPNQFWHNRREIYKRERVQKHKLINVLENFDPNKSAANNLYDNGFLRFWDCGNDKWVWIRE